MKERRKYMRFDDDACIDIFYELTGRRPLKKKARLKDVSREGLRILGKNALLKGSYIDMEIKMPTKNRFIPAFGEVVWSKNVDNTYYDTGMRFTKIQKEDRVDLLDYAYDEWLKAREQQTASV